MEQLTALEWAILIISILGTLAMLIINAYWIFGGLTKDDFKEFFNINKSKK